MKATQFYKMLPVLWIALGVGVMGGIFLIGSVFFIVALAMASWLYKRPSSLRALAVSRTLAGVVALGYVVIVVTLMVDRVTPLIIPALLTGIIAATIVVLSARSFKEARQAEGR